MTCNLLNSLLLYRRDVGTPVSSGTEKIVGRRRLDKERHLPHASGGARPPAADPIHKHHRHDQGESVPGDRILQMLVAQVRRQRAGARQPAGWLRAFQFNVKGRDLAPALRSCNPSGVARKPDIAAGIILCREHTARFRPAHHADVIGATGGGGNSTRGGVLPSLRHKTAIDDDNPASRELRRRKRPIAGPRNVAAQCRTARIDERLGARYEGRGKFHVAELVLCRIELYPALARDRKSTRLNSSHL